MSSNILSAQPSPLLLWIWWYKHWVFCYCPCGSVLFSSFSIYFLPIVQMRWILSSSLLILSSVISFYYSTHPWYFSFCCCISHFHNIHLVLLNNFYFFVEIIHLWQRLLRNFYDSFFKSLLIFPVPDLLQCWWQMFVLFILMILGMASDF